MAMLSDYQRAMVEHLLATANELPARFPLVSAGEFLRLMKEPPAAISPGVLRRPGSSADPRVERELLAT
jgi:hypothetical protein